MKIKLWHSWRQLRKHHPWHSAIDIWVADYLFDDPKWWENDASKWRRFLFNNCCEVSEFIKHRWPWCTHLVVNDQCGIPEHRYCVHCMNPRPNAPLAP